MLPFSTCRGTWTRVLEELGAAESGRRVMSDSWGCEGSVCVWNSARGGSEVDEKSERRGGWDHSAGSWLGRVEGHTWIV